MFLFCARGLTVPSVILLGHGEALPAYLAGLLDSSVSFLFGLKRFPPSEHAAPGAQALCKWRLAGRGKLFSSSSPSGKSRACRVAVAARGPVAVGISSSRHAAGEPSVFSIPEGRLSAQVTGVFLTQVYGSPWKRAGFEMSCS